MKQEMRWGVAVVIAVAAAVGISSQSTSRPREGAPTGRQAEQRGNQSKADKQGVQSPCLDLVELFQDFLPTKNVAGPDECYESSDRPPATAPDKSKGIGFRPNFIIATFPDPLHTHFSLLFDRFVEAIQQGAQDEGYEYDSSWLPWEKGEPSLTLLRDQDEADDRKKNREDQPGVVLFRKAVYPYQDNAKQAPVKQQEQAQAPYQEGLVVFIVGEDPTDGIHRKQFTNAVAWITALKKDGNKRVPVAILGPTFSGSFPSLSELLSNSDVRDGLSLNRVSSNPLAIYSGSVTSKDDAEQFAKNPLIAFHSFLQDDDTVLLSIA